MTGPTHAISGLAAAVLIGRLTPFSPDALNLLTLLVGSLAPDIDGNGVITKPGTIMRRFLGRTLAELIDIVASFGVSLVHVFFRHRGLLHSPLLAFGLFGLGFALSLEWLMWFAIGYAVHLLGDACTSSGIPCFAPFSDRRLSFSSIRVGSGSELVLATGLLLFTIVCGWTLLPAGVKETHVYLYELVSKRLSGG